MCADKNILMTKISRSTVTSSVSNRWTGIWNGTMNIANSCNWHCSSRLSYLLCLELLSHRRGCRSKSSVQAYFLYHDVIFRKSGFPNLGVPRRLATVQYMGATLTTIKASTKVVRSRKDQCTQTKMKAKRLRIKH